VVNSLPVAGSKSSWIAEFGQLPVKWGIPVKVHGRSISDILWNMILVRAGTKRTFAEKICSENNSVLFDYGTPMAQKPDF
jgi:hypothetical protein